MLDNIIIPFQGFAQFFLYQSLEEAKIVLQRRGLDYTIEVWDNTDCTNPVPWTIVKIEDKMQLFFAKNKLFKIYFCNDCDARLPNGISLGMDLNKAVEIDPALRYDDWEEDYQSPLGYWIEDDLDTNKVMSITIFIKEALDEDLFEEYNW